MRIWLSRPHMSGTERRLVEEVFDSNFVAPVGPMLDRFERNFADYLGGGVSCAAVSSGTAALHLALRLKGVEPGSEVWTGSMTFAGGAFPILYQGAQPVFFDLSPTDWTMDADLLEEALRAAARNRSLPQAVVPTDLYGQSVDIDRFESICERYGVALIVDSAESAGAERDGRKAGTGGDAAILSFNGNKIITTSGGGMLVSRDAGLIQRARVLSTQAREPAPHYEHSQLGYNYRMSNLAAAVGVGQLGVLGDRVAARRRLFTRYRDALARPGITFMPEPDGAHSTRWLTVMTVDPDIAGITREDLRLALLAREIESRPMWKPMHMQPLFAGARYVGRRFDEGLFDRGLCLPSGSDLTVSEQDEVIGVILELLDRRIAC
ncbi:perosamine synthetase [Palleronia marisminoris]|uniref:Putative pyridoxal phosphate-dependent aminotransferase EpsN n=1 Tax=Palleronia marisminoris TaxID=315423 RepID=A0A1Y5SXA6_9RHOB|nr:aminotransferase class I/II-fold pyridoxal phosphate-dependent enzyme [Palleronia marisminoris]SFH05945.1 perosamine synthetase [Palleronia marisminoris]SLN50989.1 Putative pyridoxal phosphate-dependent aminotransferase EpsN [Palleronia marisminoris]